MGRPQSLTELGRVSAMQTEGSETRLAQLLHAQACSWHTWLAKLCQPLCRRVNLVAIVLQWCHAALAVSSVGSSCAVHVMQHSIHMRTATHTTPGQLATASLCNLMSRSMMPISSVSQADDGKAG